MHWSIYCRYVDGYYNIDSVERFGPDDDRSEVVARKRAKTLAAKPETDWVVLRLIDFHRTPEGIVEPYIVGQETIYA